MRPDIEKGAPPAKAENFDKQKAWAHLEKQVAFGPRMPGTKAHQDCENYIFDEMSKYCENVRRQPFEWKWSQTGETFKLNNILGEQNWKNASVRVVLFTHWDSRAMAEKDPDPVKRKQPIPAANDGASGVAVMLELMRVLKAKAPNVGIMYFMTDGEDLGPGEDEMYLGALYFADHLPQPKPTYGILLDMIGDKDLSVPMEQRSVQAAPDLMNALYRHAQAVGLGGTFPMTPGSYMDDDHAALIAKNIPTIDLIDFDYDDWHKSTDTPDKCSAESLEKVGRLLQTWFQLPKPWRPGMTSDDSASAAQRLALHPKATAAKAASKRPAKKPSHR